MRDAGGPEGGAPEVEREDPGRSVMDAVGDDVLRDAGRALHSASRLRHASPMAADPFDDYYALLGVEADADGEALRQAWKRLARRWHPDRAGAVATPIFQRISTAYEVLSDPVARASYDRRRGVSSKPRATGSVAPTPPRPTPGVMLSRLSGPLNALMACGAARRAEGDVIELLLGEREAEHGGMATISMRVAVRCEACGGRAGSACARCASRGTVDELYAAWLAVPPGVADGAVLTPTVGMRGMVRSVSFRMRVLGAG